LNVDELMSESVVIVHYTVTAELLLIVSKVKALISKISKAVSVFVVILSK